MSGLKYGISYFFLEKIIIQFKIKNEKLVLSSNTNRSDQKTEKNFLKFQKISQLIQIVILKLGKRGKLLIK